MNNNIDQINKAILTHGLWRERLEKAIETRRFEVSVEDLAKDNICDFGKWLYEDIDPVEKHGARYKDVLKRHADVHRHASKILSLILEGSTEEAIKALDACGECVKTSAGLIHALEKWKDAEEKKALF